MYGEKDEWNSSPFVGTPPFTPSLRASTIAWSVWLYAAFLRCVVTPTKLSPIFSSIPAPSIVNTSLTLWRPPSNTYVSCFFSGIRTLGWVSTVIIPVEGTLVWNFWDIGRTNGVREAWCNWTGFQDVFNSTRSSLTVSIQRVKVGKYSRLDIILHWRG